MLFGDMFDTAEDLLSGSNAQVLHKGQRRGNCIADELDLPPQLRAQSNFVGLKNLGATCYLNSLIQSFYMCPEFRNNILKIKLYNGKNLENPNPIFSQSKLKILYSIQKMMVDLQNLNVRSIDLREMTKAFGWEDNEEYEQHDIQDAMMEIFDAIEGAVKNTEYEEIL